MTQIEVERIAAADPAGVALLLAGPTPEDLWPGVSGSDQPGLVLGAPTRAGVGFVVEVDVADPGLGGARGRVVVEPAPTGAGTTVRLQLTSSDVVAPIIRHRASVFVDALAQLAQSRSSAA